jgi:hypothetical protein
VRRSLALCACLAIAAAPLCAQQRKACLVVLDNADHNLTTNTITPGNTIVDVAGNVRMHCKGLPVTLRTDSLSMLSGDYARLYGRSVYNDTSYQLSADTLIYLTRMEKLEARGHVRVIDKTSGSILVGPWVDYWRQVKGINDSARVEAIQRPTVRYFSRATPIDTIRQRPLVVIGDRLRGFGQSRLWGDGAVTIERDSVHGAGDSLSFERAKVSLGNLYGRPATLRRVGADSFAVFGKTIRVTLDEDRIRELRAFLTARVVRGGSDIAADTLHLSFASDKLSLTLAWARDSGARLRSNGYDVRGDSLAVETPAEQLREVRVFKRGIIQNPRDTSAFVPAKIVGDTVRPDSTRNTLWGNRIVARFGQVDSVGTLVTRLRGLQAYGQARSLFSRTVTKDGRVTPSINYTRADTIVIVMRGGDSTGVASVQAFGHVDGTQLETASLRRPADTTKAGRGVKP